MDDWDVSLNYETHDHDLGVLGRMPPRLRRNFDPTVDNEIFNSIIAHKARQMEVKTIT